MTSNALNDKVRHTQSGSGATYFWLTASCLAIAILGFLPTYWMIMAQDRFNAHPLMHMHAAIFYSWTAFLVFQSWLVTKGRVPSHRDWGMAGISLATLVLTFGALTAIHAGVRATESGFGAEAQAFLIVPLSGIVLFAGFVAAAIANIRKPDAHKALMLAATSSMLGAPVARWFLTFLAPPGAMGPPPVEVTVLPAIIGLAPMFALLIIQWRTRGAPQRVGMIATGIAVAVALLVVPVSKTGAWRSLAEALIGLG